jgi:hypothetical protein
LNELWAKGGEAMATGKLSSEARHRLLVSTAMLGALCVGYGRRAYAGCTGTLGTYSCSGANTTTITLSPTPATSPLFVTTTSGFSVITTTGDALDLTTTSSSVPSGGVDLSFTDANASTITGAHSGIYAKNSGPEGLTISSNGTVTGQALYGIFADNATSSASFLSITALNASGGSGPGGAGIKAVNFGDKGTHITATGTVSGYFGITVKNYATSVVTQAVSIYAATVTGAYEGIYAANKSSHGDLKISTTGTVTGATGKGIYASNQGGALTINAATVTGHTDGIAAKNFGTGALSITATGTVTGTTRTGVYGYNSPNSLSGLTISAATVTGANGVVANNDGTGALSVTTGTVTGTNGYGIKAINQPNGTSATIIAQGGVSGTSTGIYGKNLGSSFLYIKASGFVTGSNGDGIHGYNSANGTSLTIKAAGVYGNTYGISALNHGNGALSITATQQVTSYLNTGILAKNYRTDLTINALQIVSSNGVVGGDGVYALNKGTGALSITVMGWTAPRTASACQDGRCHQPI